MHNLIHEYIIACELSIIYIIFQFSELIQISY